MPALLLPHALPVLSLLLFDVAWAAPGALQMTGAQSPEAAPSSEPDAEADSAAPAAPAPPDGEPWWVECMEAGVLVETKEITPRWLPAIGAACAMAHTNPDRDTRVRVVVRGAGQNLKLEAWLPDGRVAQRELLDPSKLRQTLTALVTLPPGQFNPAAQKSAESTAASAETTPREPLATPLAVASAPRSNPQTAGTGRVSTHAPDTFAIDLGMGGHLRLAASPSAYGFLGAAAYAGVHVAPWLFGVQLRWDAWQFLKRSDPSNFRYTDLGVGLFAAQRLIQAPGAHLDVGAAVSLLVESQSTGVGAAVDADSAADVKIGALARLKMGAVSPHLFTGLDVEVSPARLLHRARIDSDLPLLPAWSLGLTVGVAWDAL